MAEHENSLLAVARLLSTGENTDLEERVKASDNPEDLMYEFLVGMFENNPNKELKFFSNLTGKFTFKARFHNDITDEMSLDNGKQEELPTDKAAHVTPAIGTTPSSLDKLPLEILQNIICDNLDLESLTKLRSLSRNLRSKIDGIPEYRDIVNHVPHILRVLLTTQAAAKTTCSALYYAFLEKNCAKCGATAGYLYLLTCQRLCSSCAPECRYLPYNLCRGFFSLKPEDMDNIITCKATNTLRSGRIAYQIVVDVPAVEELAEMVHGGQAAVKAIRNKRKSDWEARVEKWEKIPEGKRTSNRPPRPSHSVLPPIRPQLAESNLFVVQMPWYNKQRKQHFDAAFCGGCICLKGSTDDADQARRKILNTYIRQNFTLHYHNDFIRHFVTCNHALQMYCMSFEQLQLNSNCLTGLHSRPFWQHTIDEGAIESMDDEMASMKVYRTLT